GDRVVLTVRVVVALLRAAGQTRRRRAGSGRRTTGGVVSSARRWRLHRGRMPSCRPSRYARWPAGGGLGRKSAWFGTRRSAVRIRPARPTQLLPRLSRSGRSSPSSADPCDSSWPSERDQTWPRICRRGGTHGMPMVWRHWSGRGGLGRTPIARPVSWVLRRRPYEPLGKQPPAVNGEFASAVAGGPGVARRKLCEACHQFRRLSHAEVRIQQPEIERKRLRSRGHDVYDAALAVDRLDRDVGGQACDDDVGGRIHHDPCPESCRGLSDAGPHIGQDVLVRRFARNKPRTAPSAKAQAIDPERPPATATAVPSHQVPAPPTMDERVGFHGARALGAVVLLVIDPENLMVAAGGRDSGQNAGGHAFVGGGRRDCVCLERVDPVPQAGGQELLELDQGPERTLLHSGYAASGRSWPCLASLRGSPGARTSPGGRRRA